MIHARDDYNRIQDPEGKIPDDEPVFLIRAQDAAAVETVMHWAKVNARVGGDPLLSAMAAKHALRMDAWQQTHKKKPADL